jgi:C_GCAxxG_C_C family probable redox protein
MTDVEQGEALAAECFSGGYNCAESVLRGVCHAQGIHLPDACLKMATPFGGGVGRAEDLCGALSGGVMAIGASLGRTSDKEDKTRSYEAAKRMFDDFVATTGSPKCGVLNMGEFGTPEHRARCGRFVRDATRIAILAIRARTE